MTDEAESNDDTSKPRRRQRYRGTHPRRFTERYKELDPERYPDIADHVRGRGNTPAGAHVPIMVEECLAVLAPAPGETVVDGTLGHGGHAAAFLERTGPDGRLIGLDVDGDELARTAQRLGRFADRLVVRRSSYAGIAKILAELAVPAVDVVFVDLGVSSMQIDDPRRGFSFKHDGPLDMRMDDRRKRTAADLVAALGVAELEDALSRLADEPAASAIARAIVAARDVRPLTTTRELARVVCQAQGFSGRVKDDGAGAHPAARTFQALRMLVNDELGHLAGLLRVVPECLRPGGRLGILTFHSGETEMVRRHVERDLAAGRWAAASAESVRPGAAERRANPRSASAHLHWARRPIT